MLHAAVAHTGSLFIVAAFRVALVLGVYFVGFTIETLTGSEDPTDGSGTMLNLLHTVILLGTGTVTGYCLKVAVDSIPFYRAPIHIRPGAGFATFALSACAIVMGDF